MLLPFIQENLHFAINLFAALASFAVAWLIFDAWSLRKERKEFFKWFGFALLSLSFLINAATINDASLNATLITWLGTAMWVIRFLGYGSIIAGEILDPLQPKPKNSGDAVEAIVEKNRATYAVGGFLIPLKLTLPFAAWGVAFLYWRRSHQGLERHLKPVAWVFMLLGFHELAALAALLRDTANVQLFNFVSLYGIAWKLEQVLLLAAAVVLMMWVWGYLVKRLLSQLFITFTALSVAIFLAVTVSFTFLLLGNVQQASIDNLKTASSVLNYAIQSKQSELSSDAEILGDSTELAKAIETGSTSNISKVVGDFAVKKHLSVLIVTDDNGKVMLRSDDPARIGDSLSEDPVVLRALLGTDASSVEVKSGVLAPTVSLTAAVPVRAADNTIIGSVMAGVVVDDAFTDGIKKQTGLDSAIYGGNIRSATSIVSPGSTSRWIGVKEDNMIVKQTVLEQGKTFAGTLNVLNSSYVAAYNPLKDADENTVGMIFVGQPQTVLFAAAARSIGLTFLLSVALLVLMIFPIYLISKKITEQLE